MGSTNAQILARKVSDTIKKGQKVSIRALAEEVGYAPSSARRSTQITRTKSFQVAFKLESREIVEAMDREIADIQLAISKKKKNKEEYKTLISSLDTLIKNKQLLSGGSTANVGINVAISEHVAGKYGDNSKDKSIDDDKKAG